MASETERSHGRTLRPSFLKWFGILLVCAAALWFSISLWNRDREVMDIICMLFFGLGAAISLVAWIPFLNNLRVDQEGFEIRTFRKRRRYEWNEIIGDFAVCQMRYNKLVVFDAKSDGNTSISRLNRRLTSKALAFPDTYGMSAADLAALMNTKKRTALSDPLAVPRSSSSIASLSPESPERSA